MKGKNAQKRNLPSENEKYTVEENLFGFSWYKNGLEMHFKTKPSQRVC